MGEQPQLIQDVRYPGQIFTRHEAEGALANGTVVRKTNSETGDATPDGTVGVVIGSLPAANLDPDVRASLPPQHRDVEFAYFIEWRTNKHMVVGTIATKVEEIT